MKLKANIELKWERQKCDGYLIYMLRDMGWKEIVRIENIDITAILVNDLDLGQEITFNVVYFVYDDERKIHRVHEKKIYCKVDSNGGELYYVEKPKLKFIEKVNEGILLKWNYSSVNNIKYRVFRKLKDGSWNRVAEVRENQFVDNTVLLGNEYVYTVRCISDDDKSYLSDFDQKGLEILYI